MIEIESRELADIPVLHAYPVGQKDTPLPCVIFYHGFTSSSLVYSYFAASWRRLVCGDHAGCARSR